MIELKRPQLASSEIPDIYDVTYPKFIQPKLDGICCLAINGVALSRTMKPIPNKQIQKYFKNYNLHGWHGELVIGLDFNETQSFVMSEDKICDKWEYIIYDRWDSDLPYEDRLLTIHNQISTKHFNQIVTHIVTTPHCASYWLESFVNQGYEGAMLRDPNSLYKQGRHTLKSQALMKLKSFSDDEAVIIGVEEKMTNTNEKEKDERGYTKRSSKKEGMVGADTLGALVVTWKGLEFKIGSGYNDEQRRDLWSIKDSIIGKLVTFKYQELSKYGIPRFPIFKTIRMDL
jgi:DNA ligase-1